MYLHFLYWALAKLIFLIGRGTMFSLFDGRFLLQGRVVQTTSCGSEVALVASSLNSTAAT